VAAIAVISGAVWPRSFPVRGELRFVTGWDWNNR
jgi:hypothetical protein